MKENELKEAVSSLGPSEKSLIEQYYNSDLLRWAKLIDSIGAYAEALASLPDNVVTAFNQCIQQYDQLIAQVRTLNIGQNANSADQLRNYITNFKNQYYLSLLEMKQRVEAASSEASDVESLKKVVADAKKERQNFEKSFSESLKKQAEGSQRTLAKHFAARLKELKEDDQTNPNEWLGKRTFWGWILVAVASILIACYVLLIHSGWIKGYELQVALLKLAIIAFLYTQYYFATKNYYIYADMVAKYEHLTVISKTMTDFIAAAFDDEILKESVLSNASKTLFSEIQTGHNKQDSKEPSIIENIINQLPKNS